MGKLKPLIQSKVIKIIEHNGFERVRSRKHITYKKKLSSGQVLTTWVPHSNEITIYVIKHIIQQTGKNREEFY